MDLQLFNAGDPARMCTKPLNLHPDREWTSLPFLKSSHNQYQRCLLWLWNLSLSSAFSFLIHTNRKPERSSSSISNLLSWIICADLYNSKPSGSSTVSLRSSWTPCSRMLECSHRVQHELHGTTYWFTLTSAIDRPLWPFSSYIHLTLSILYVRPLRYSAYWVAKNSHSSNEFNSNISILRSD